MRNDVKFIALFLLATAAFAQHGGGMRSGSSMGVAHGSGHVAAPGSGHRDARIISNRRRSGRTGANGFYTPYYPFFDGYADESLPNDNGPVNELSPQPSFTPPTAEASPAVPAQTAHAVVSEYKWKSAVVPNRQGQTFTLALKDGSKRYPVASWVQNGKLHVIDAQGRQEVLPADRIDRDVTDRLNSEKNLQMQLPPG